MIQGYLSIRGSSEFCECRPTWHSAVKAAGLNPRVGDRIGHPAALFPETEEIVRERILYLEKEAWDEHLFK